MPHCACVAAAHGPGGGGGGGGRSQPVDGFHMQRSVGQSSFDLNTSHGGGGGGGPGLIPVNPPEVQPV